MPTNAEALKLIGRRHPEWREFETRWRWLQDSLEGGNRYRFAVYGVDRLGEPRRNLVRHKRETPDPSDKLNGQQSAYVGGIAANPFTATGGGMPANTSETDPYGSTVADDYGLRLARTPVPTFVSDAIDTHLSRIFAREVDRDGPKALLDWWDNVDGRGMTADQWMADTIAPLLLVCGNLDIVLDHPSVAANESPTTQADVIRLGLTAVVAAYVLPENMLWWRLNPDGTYAECIVRECSVDLDGKPVEHIRHWTVDDSTLYDREANALAVVPHSFGLVPIVRLFDRKKPRCDNVGQSRYESIAEIQREFYNRDSELILSDTTQAHPLIQGPEDYVQADGTVPIGPSWMLPKKKNSQGGTATYEGFDVIEFPKDGAESIRKNKGDLRDEADRAAHLTKPAGTAGTSGASVGQSGLSKRLDSTTGNDVLGKIAGVLHRAETRIARLALAVAANGKPKPADIDAITISYPKQFDLATADELGAMIERFQGILAAAGEAPETEEAMLCRFVRLALPGLDDDEYEAFDTEITATLATKATHVDQSNEAALTTTNANAAVAQSTAKAAMNPDQSSDPAPVGEGAD